jgi:formylglycine-generating enzyme required for sulfatase activity
MSGNVYNWCLDEDENDQRALCGGSWKSYPGFMTIDACHYDLPENSSDYWGFRLVCDAVKTAEEISKQVR